MTINLLEQVPTQNYLQIATKLTQELLKTVQERDAYNRPEDIREAGLPNFEVAQLREAGLLPLVVPKCYGGASADWITAHQIVKQLSKVDGSIGQLYGNHLNLVAGVQLLGTPAQAEHYYRLTAQHHLFWGNAANARDTRLKITPDGDCYRVNGTKAFSTGAAVADLRVISAIREDNSPVFFIIPKDRKGVVYNHDWDNMGQRRTASGSHTFHNVLVYPDELLGPVSETQKVFASFLTVIAQLKKAYVCLGIAEGAFEAATAHINRSAHSWIPGEKASQDSYTLRNYGELWTKLQAAIALLDRTAEQVQEAWDKGEQLTLIERGEASLAVAATTVFVVQVGLEVVTRIFDGMGARATAAKWGFDRYWRDLRTYSLHDPIDYKLRDLGNWALNQELPEITPYS
jgi:alkylation response protein AidB-like acyl-CoA dehydrogenase